MRSQRRYKTRRPTFKYAGPRLLQRKVLSVALGNRIAGSISASLSVSSASKDIGVSIVGPRDLLFVGSKLSLSIFAGKSRIFRLNAWKVRKSTLGCRPEL